MLKVVMLYGLPASGKSTFAKEMIAKYPNAYKRISKDDLRAMLDDGKYSKTNEKFVLKMRDALILETLKAGKCPIVDDTNLAPKHYDHITEMVKGLAVVELIVFDTPYEECVARDLRRPKSVGERVIRQMYNQYLRKKKSKPKFEPMSPDVIICDLDGTLAQMNGRSPFDWDKVDTDTVNITIKNMISGYRKLGIPTIIVSGRDSVCRAKTEKWLADNGIQYMYLFMRPEGDNRKDSIVKQEIYEKYIYGKANVLFVLDDRDQVVEMWRDQGLACLQVNDGNF